MIRLQRPTYSQRVQSLLNNRRQNARICVQMRRIDKRCGCCLLMSRLFVQGFPREKTNSPQRRDGTGRDEHEQIRLDSEELVHAGCTRQSEFVSSFDWSARHHYYRFRRVERSPNFRIFPRPNQIPTPFVSRSIDDRSILLAILKVRGRKYAQNR